MRDWQPINTAPQGVRLELAVIEKGEVYALTFPCQRTERGWVDAVTQAPVHVDPTNWREWLPAVRNAPC